MKIVKTVDEVRVIVKEWKKEESEVKERNKKE